MFCGKCGASISERHPATFRILSLKIEEDSAEIEILDDNGNKTEVSLPARISSRADIQGVYDRIVGQSLGPNAGYLEAKDKGGKSYWVVVGGLSYSRTRDYIEAEVSERSGRYEDAAHKYEWIARVYGDEECYDKARELRDKARGAAPKKMVSLDINALIQQIKDGGLVIAYRCPHCGSSIQIRGDMELESLQFCNFCGSKIEAISLAQFLKSALS
jgi:rRNA maturation protein Nop10